MFNSLRGIVEVVSPGELEVRVGGVGYLVHLVTRAEFFTFSAGNEHRIWIRAVVKEDRFDLYGFLDLETRQDFDALLEVKGVGAATARKVLAKIGPFHRLRPLVQAGMLEAPPKLLEKLRKAFAATREVVR